MPQIPKKIWELYSIRIRSCFLYYKNIHSMVNFVLLINAAIFNSCDPSKIGVLQNKRLGKYAAVSQYFISGAL